MGTVSAPRNESVRPQMEFRNEPETAPGNKENNERNRKLWKQHPLSKKHVHPT